MYYFNAFDFAVLPFGRDSPHAKETWQGLIEIKDYGPNVMRVVAVTCSLLNLDARAFNVSGKRGPWTAPGARKLKFPEKVVRIAQCIGFLKVL